MDDECFDVLYKLVGELSPRRGKRCQYSDGCIVLILLWAALRQKPIAWARDPRNAPRALRDRPLPSSSQMSRRLRSKEVEKLLEKVIDHLQQQMIVASTLLGLWMMDAKGLPVSPYSKDKEAKWGYCNGRKARGYKLFLLCDGQGLPVQWHVDSMNVAEPTVAVQLLKSLDRPGYVLGDSIYDSNALFLQASEKQVQLIAPRKEPAKPIGRRARSDARLHAIDMMETYCNQFGRALYQKRTTIERSFARWAASTVGLDHLPGWVRTRRRVRRWVQAKILIALALAPF